MSRSGRPREFQDTSVIDAAMEVFWANGYEACSTDDLCKHTGLGRGSLYNAFGSKHELYEKALLHYHETGIAAQIRLLQHPGPVKERLKSLLDWAIDQDYSDNGRKGCLLINAAMERAQKDPSVERIFQQHIGKLEHAIGQTIELGQQSGELSSECQAADIASLFLSSYYGLRVLNTAGQSRDKAEQMAKAMLAAV